VIQADEGMYCEEGERISIKNLTLLSKDTNPVITIHNSRQVLLDALQYKKGSELLMRLSGETTKDIRLLNTDVSNAKKDFQFADGVSNNVVSKR
jgi:DNA sulfur modification protein DndE